MFNIEELKIFLQDIIDEGISDEQCYYFQMVLDKINEMQRESYTIMEMKCDMASDSDYEAQYTLG